MEVIVGIKPAPGDHESNFKKKGSITFGFNTMGTIWLHYSMKMRYKIFILGSDLFWQMQIILIQGLKFRMFGEETFTLQCVFIEFVIPNLSLICFCVSKVFKTSIWNTVFDYKEIMCAWNSQRLLCSKKMWLNQSIKAFWYIIVLFDTDLVRTM